MKSSEFIKKKIDENASAGASSAGSVGSINYSLGSGDPNASIYAKKKPKKMRESNRSEYSANLELQHSAEGDVPHHVYTIKNGQKVGIAGPFKNRTAAEKHPARKLGVGTIPSHMLKK